jgi:(S)-3,5-dihydroxyphenylglycine transaminase
MLTAHDLHASLSDPSLAVMTFLNEVTLRYPDAVSFAPGRPYEGFFAVNRLRSYLDTYLDHLTGSRGLNEAQVTRELFQYGPASGTIRELIAAMLARDDGIPAEPKDIVVTAGCQEALVVVLRTLFSGPDDVLLVPSPTYTGVTGAALLLDVTVELVQDGPGGLEPERVRQSLRRLTAAGRRPRALYLVPEASNPTGVSLSEATRRELLDIACEFGILLLEDHAYAVFSPAGSPPALKAMDTESRVIHIGTFAKSGFPGLRVGYLVADQTVRWPDGSTRALAAALADVKSMVTVNTSPITQALAGGLLLQHGLSLRAANTQAAEFYRTNLHTAAAALAKRFAGSGSPVSWNEPDRGFFMVVTVGFDADEGALEACARDYGVLWTPMRYFQAAGGERQIRLSVSYLEPEQIRLGIDRFADFIDDRCAGLHGVGPVPEAGNALDGL